LHHRRRVCHAAGQPEGNDVDAGDTVPTVLSEQRVCKVVHKKVTLAATRMAMPNMADRNDEPVDGWMEEMFHHCSRCARSMRRHSTLVSVKNIYLFLLFFDHVDLNTPTYNFVGYLKIKGLALYMFEVVEQ
jgi:hypothetical protein